MALFFLNEILGLWRVIWPSLRILDAKATRVVGELLNARNKKSPSAMPIIR